MEEYIRYVMNTKGGKGSIRREKYDGKTYMVAPAAMIAEGVWAGSKGPVFYSNPELQKTESVWNTKPAVLHHPELNGKGISACDPNILETRGLGLVFNTKHDSKLRTEVWFDEVKTKKVCPDVLSAIENGDKIEISTGLFADIEVSPGVFNGKKYDYVAKNIRPDHLAILPDKIGAYSVEDGGGILANSSNETDLFGPITSQEDLDIALQLIGNNKGDRFDKMRERLQTIASTLSLKMPEPVRNKEVKESKPLSKEDYLTLQKIFIDQSSEEKVSITIKNADGSTTLVNNAVSHRDVAKGIGQAMHNENKDSGYWPGYIEDVYPNFFVYSERGKYYKRDYGVDTKNNVAVGNAPEQVKKHQEWQKMTGSHIAVTNRDMSQSYMIMNPGYGNVTANVQDVTTNKGADSKMSTKVQTTEEYIANAPPGPIQESLEDMLAGHKSIKSSIIANIMKHPKNGFTELELHAKKLSELQTLEAMLVPDAPVRRAIYGGQGGTPPINQAAGGGNTPAGPPEPLGSPIWNFKGEKKTAAAK